MPARKGVIIMKKVILAVILLGMATGCFLGDKAGEISGQVTHSGIGLEGVTITTNPETSTETTGQDGKYSISGIDKTQAYIVTASKSGYISSSETVVLEVGTFSCAKPTKDNVNFMLSNGLAFTTKFYTGTCNTNPFTVNCPAISNLALQDVTCYCLSYKQGEWWELPVTYTNGGITYEDQVVVSQSGYVKFTTLANGALYSGNALTGASYLIVVKTFS